MSKNGITVLSLFDGCRMGMLACNKANLELDKYYSSEIEPNAIKIGDKNFPNTIDYKLGDITNWRNWDIDWSSIDLLIGGSPCQGFSRAGAGLNFEDPRSKLFFEYVNILNYTRQHNPNIKFLLENVCMKKEWEDIITNYVKINPIKINSSLLSAQKRPRTYWTNINDGNIPQPIDKNIVINDILEKGINIKDYPLSENEKSIISFVGKELRVNQATKLGYAIAEIGDSINLSCPNSKTRRGRVGKGKCNTLDTNCNYAVYTKEGIRKFTFIEKERLQTLTDNYTEGVSVANRNKMIGNGWTVDVIAYILSFYNKQ